MLKTKLALSQRTLLNGFDSTFIYLSYCPLNSSSFVISNQKHRITPFLKKKKIKKLIMASQMSDMDRCFLYDAVTTPALYPPFIFTYELNLPYQHDGFVKSMT